MNEEKDRVTEAEQSAPSARSRVKVVLLAILAVCLVAALSAAAFAAGRNAAVLRRGDAPEPVIEEITEYKTEYLWNDNGESWDPSATMADVKPVRNYLLVGIDNTYNLQDRGNADGIVIASINTETKQIVLTSLMRDINVSVPNKYRTKLTMAYHYGGIKDLVDTVEYNFNIELDGYVVFSYFDVRDIVDALDGVTLELTPSEVYYANEKLHDLCGAAGEDINKNLIPVKTGAQKLNGLQAAAYSRVRSTANSSGDNNDYARTERVRSVIVQLRDKTMELPVDELLELYAKLMSGLDTGIPQGELMELALNSTTYLGYEVISQRIPLDGTGHTENLGGSMLVIDFEVNNRHLHSTIYEGKPPESVDEITVLGETENPTS